MLASVRAILLPAHSMYTACGCPFDVNTARFGCSIDQNVT